MHLISLVHCSLIKIINDQILYQLSKHNLENVATVHLLVLISILCFRHSVLRDQLHDYNLLMYLRGPT